MRTEPPRYVAVMTNFSWTGPYASLFAWGKRTVIDMDQTPMAPMPPAPSLIVCPYCKLELFLVGTELEKPGRDVYTFECPKCHHLEARGVAVL